MKNNIGIDIDYWVGEHYSNDCWQRLTLFYKKTNSQSGSINTPVAKIDIVNHPGLNGCNPHYEIKISVRNDIKRNGVETVIDKNNKILRHPAEIIEDQILRSVVKKLKEEGLVTVPLSIFVCTEHVEKFETEGDFWTED